MARHPDLPDAWVRGLARNPAAPASVIRRIITVPDRVDYPLPWLRHFELSAEVLAEIATVSDPKVRRDVAQNPHTDVETLARLAADATQSVRFNALMAANDRGVLLPAQLAAGLVDDAHEGIRTEAQIQQTRHQTVSADSSSAPAPPPEPAAPVAILPRSEAEPLITSPDPEIRGAAAGDPRVPRDLALRLAGDPDDTVRLCLSLREDLSDDERQAIPYIVPDGYHRVPSWIKELGTDPEALTRLASSRHVLIRRSVAAFRHLPPEAVALLAADEDFFVRLTLCQNCVDAPHEVLIEMYAWWHGKTAWFLQFRPNFHRPGFAKYATHINLRLRALSLRDPELSVAEVVRLASDPELRGAAVSDPRLPTADLEAVLFGGDGYAGAAASNPRLPPAVMHLLLDLAAVPQDPDAAAP